MIETSFNKVLSNVGMKHSKEVIERARQMASEGNTIHVISLTLGVSENTIGKWVRGYCKISRWPQSTREEAIKLINLGYSKSKVSEAIGVPLATIIKWRIPNKNERLRYSPETREKARELVRSGVSKLQTAVKLGVDPKTIYNWTLDLHKDSIIYPQKLKHKIRYLVRKGMSKVEVAEALGVGYTTVIRWTTDLHNNNSKVSARYFLILRELLLNGYIITERKDIHIYKTLMKWIPNIKSIVVGYHAIYYMEKNKKEAFNGLSKKFNLEVHS